VFGVFGALDVPIHPGGSARLLAAVSLGRPFQLHRQPAHLAVQRPDSGPQPGHVGTGREVDQVPQPGRQLSGLLARH
jgi:hypothetical protein